MGHSALGTGLRTGRESPSWAGLKGAAGPTSQVSGAGFLCLKEGFSGVNRADQDTQTLGAQPSQGLELKSDEYAVFDQWVHFDQTSKHRSASTFSECR